MFRAGDAGGTSTCAVLIDTLGRAHGYGRAGGGNPRATGIEPAAEAIGYAAERAMGNLIDPGQPSHALIAMAGDKTAACREQVVGRLAGLGVSEVVLEPDLLGMFHSGTPARDGYALIAGT